MKKVRSLVPVLLLLILSVSVLPTSAEIYKYTDESGNIRYTDDLNMVPVNQRQMADEYTEMQNPASPPEAAQEIQTSTPGAAVRDRSDILEASLKLNETREALEKERARLIKAQEDLGKARRATNSRAVAKKHMDRVAQFKQETQAYEKKRQAYEQDLARYTPRSTRLTGNRPKQKSSLKPKSSPKPNRLAPFSAPPASSSGRGSGLAHSAQDACAREFLPQRGLMPSLRSCFRPARVPFQAVSSPAISATITSFSTLTSRTISSSPTLKTASPQRWAGSPVVSQS